MTDDTVASTLDCRGLVCPLPIVKLSRAIKALQVGQIIELLSTDPGSLPDLEAFQKQTGHRLVEHSEQEGVFRFLVQRTR